MDPTLIGLELGLLLAIVYILEPNLPYYLWLRIDESFINIRLHIYRRLLGVRLWIDRQAMLHRGPVGKLWNEYCLWRIRNNPAYRELFQDLPKVQDE